MLIYIYRKIYLSLINDAEAKPCIASSADVKPVSILHHQLKRCTTKSSVPYKETELPRYHSN